MNSKLIFLKALILFAIPLNLFCQRNLSYKELTPLLGLVKNHLCSVLDNFDENDELLRKNLLTLNWDFDKTETFDTLYEQLKDQSIDYRYNLIIAKATSDYYRKNNWSASNTNRYIEYYYKSLFLNLAIQNNDKRYNPFLDSLKFQYTKQYINSTLTDSCFPSEIEFNEFANQNIKYAKDLLRSYRLNLSKVERSELYYIIADAIYRTTDVENEDKENLSEVFKYLTLSLNENPDNWRALSERAMLKKTVVKNYHLALSDYLRLLNVFEKENKLSIAEHNKWLLKQKLISYRNKMFFLRPTFENMMDIVECYLNLNDSKNVLFWLNKATVSIKEYREYSVNAELASQYEGMIYFLKAGAHFYIKETKIACIELEKAINFGYDIDECSKLQIEMNCIKKPLINSDLGVNSIPMKMIGGVYEIPITINGALKINFIFDAGAADVSISSDVALTLIRTGTVKNEDFIGTETYKFADGSTAKSKVFIIKEIELGNRKIFNVKASISNSLTAPLLLGQSVLNQFGRVMIDYKNQVIIFEN
jgi:aspartyl protease family protein